MSTDEFTRLHAEVAPRLWAWASVHLGPELRPSVDADDVLQEVTCRAWRRQDTFDPARGDFAAWFFGIARNVLGELLARIARGEGVAHGWSTERWARLPDDATRATARVAREEHVRRLVDWADGLDEGDRRLFLFRGLEGAGLGDVAAMLGISDNAAQKRWAELRQRLARRPRFQALLAPDQGT